MNLVRWEPFSRDFATLAERLNRVMDPLRWSDLGRESMSGWYPPVDIHEDGDDIVLSAELPGMKKEDIDIRVENNVLSLQGKRERETEIKENGYFRSERSYGTFSRAFTLPTTVDVAKIKAVYKDGVLTVTLPKLEAAKPKQIEVKVS